MIYSHNLDFKNCQNFLPTDKPTPWSSVPELKKLAHCVYSMKIHHLCTFTLLWNSPFKFCTFYENVFKSSSSPGFAVILWIKSLLNDDFSDYLFLGSHQCKQHLIKTWAFHSYLNIRHSDEWVQMEHKKHIYFDACISPY